jgi:hypothetical protein
VRSSAWFDAEERTSVRRIREREAEAHSGVVFEPLDPSANLTADVVDHFAAKRRNRSSLWFSACPVIKPSSQVSHDGQALVVRIDAPIKQTRVPPLEARGDGLPTNRSNPLARPVLGSSEHRPGYLGGRPTRMKPKE